MTIRKTLWPGDPGTKNLVKQFGDDLICIRYRYDPVKKVRYKTIEIILDEKSWKPDPKRIPWNKRMNIRIGKYETTVQALVQSHGGEQIPDTDIWILPYHIVKKLDITRRITSLKNPSHRS